MTDADIDRFVGARLRHLRWRAGLNQVDVAAAVGVSYQTIQKYEAGDNRISASRLIRIADALSVPVAEFFPGLESGDYPDWHNRDTMLMARAYDALPSERRKLITQLVEAMR